MSKAVKVEDHVYQELDMIREKGETFSQIIERLLQARIQMFETLNMIEGILRYEQYKQKKLLEVIKKDQRIGAIPGYLKE